MSEYLEMSAAELQTEFSAVKSEYEKLRSLHLSLDMSRGKPGADNMDLSEKMFDLVGNDTGFKNIDGIDCRNYGGLDGLRDRLEARELAEAAPLRPTPALERFCASQRQAAARRRRSLASRRRGKGIDGELPL